MNIFVASTYTDLQDYRAAAQRIIHSADHRAELVERFEGASTDGIVLLLRSILRTCHACVLIVGSRRGAGPQDASEGTKGDSYTMIEFVEAVRANIPLFPFFIDLGSKVDSHERSWVAGFRNLIKGHATHISVSTLHEFKSELAFSLEPLKEMKLTNPSDREQRRIDDREIHRLLGPFKPGAAEFLNTPRARDTDAHRQKAHLQGFPAHHANSEFFKKANLINDQGWACHEIGDYSQAKTFYDQALELCPSFPLIWNNKGLAMFRLGDTEGAKKCYFAAIQQAPGFVTPWSNLAVLYWERFQDSEATCRWLERAEAISPDYPDVKMLRKVMTLVDSLKSNNSKESERRLIFLLKHYPRETLYFAVPALKRAEMGAYGQALVAIDKALEMSPMVVAFMVQKADYLCNLEKFSEAEEVAKQAKEIDPDWCSPWIMLSWAFAGLEKWKACVEAATHAIELGGELDDIDAALTNAVVAFIKMAMFDKAREMIENYASKYPSSTRPAQLLDHIATIT